MRNAFFIGVFSLLALPATGAVSTAPMPMAPVAVYSAADVGAFLAACRGDQGGCMDEIGTALMAKMNYAGESNICLPSTDYGAPVPKWLAAHPETSKMPMEDGIYLALRSIYPCA